MRHSSHYIERTFYYAFIALFAVSVFLLLANIDSFTAMASLTTAQIADSCEKTLPSSTPCAAEYDKKCSSLQSKQYVISTHGETLCCCVQPPKISTLTK